MPQDRERRNPRDRRRARMRQHELRIGARAIPVAQLESQPCPPREHVEEPRVEIVLLAISDARFEIPGRVFIPSMLDGRRAEIRISTPRMLLKAIFESKRQAA